MSDQIDVSIIIVNLNTRQLLRDCLLSLQDTNDGVSLETIVVDNGSTDGSSQMVAEQFPQITLLCNQTNEGFARPNNQGLQIARGRYLLLLNSDTVVRPHALERLVRFMDEHPAAGACGPRLLFPDERLQPSCPSYPSLWRHCCDMSGLENLLPRSIFGNSDTRFAHDRDAEVGQLMGAALLVRRETFEQIGYLDERLKIYYNDVDWCLRIRQAGWKIYFVYGAEVVHYGGQTTAVTNRRFEQFDEMYRNVLFYYEKHFGRGTVVLYKLLMVAGFTPRIIFWQMVLLKKKDVTARWRLTNARKSLRVGLRFWRMSS